MHKQPKLIASSSRDKSIRVWNFESNQCTNNFYNKKLTWTLIDSGLMSMSSLLSGSNDGWVSLWDIRTSIVARECKFYNDIVTGIELFDDCQSFATCCYDGTIKVHDVRNFSNPLCSIKHPYINYLTCMNIRNKKIICANRGAMYVFDKNGAVSNFYSRTDTRVDCKLVCKNNNIASNCFNSDEISVWDGYHMGDQRFTVPDIEQLSLTDETEKRVNYFDLDSSKMVACVEQLIPVDAPINRFRRAQDILKKKGCMYVWNL
ncbi:mitochondrial division protein 1 [Acrasis kona]|uniref:Mitochondrial division protein 1 n=1 Tax=Acrasis kona TaxID=1008807 RepID=A0AAW2YWA4_9EUKA